MKPADRLAAARTREKERVAEAVRILREMPVPDGCRMNIIRCKSCKKVQAWVFLEGREDPPGYFYDPCRCLLDMTAGTRPPPARGDGTILLDSVSWED